VGGLLGTTAHATQAQSSNWAGYADTSGTFNSVASTWTQPAVNCANSSSGGGLLGLGGLLGGGSGAASSFWVGLDGFNSSSVEQVGSDSDCNGSTPSYYAWYEMYPNPSVTLPSTDPVYPGDQMSAWVASNTAGTSYYLAITDKTHPWAAPFSTTQTASGFARSSAEVVAEAPSSCNILFCSEESLADFGQVDFTGSGVYNSGTAGSLASFGPNQITMVNGGATLATPSSLSADGTSFSVAWSS
jgi:hypothetical protein